MAGISAARHAAPLTTSPSYTPGGLQVACWYNLRNDYWSHDENSVEAQYGLLQTNFTPKLSYAAFKAYTPGSGGGETVKTEEPASSGGSRVTESVAS